MTTYAERIMAGYESRRTALGLIGTKPLPPEERNKVINETVALIIEEERAKWGGAPLKPAPVPRKRNELLDALVSLCGGDPETTTKSEFRTAASALAEIKTVCPGLTIEELTSRCATYRQKNKDWALTPPALAKWWSHLGGGPRTASERTDIYMEPSGWRAVLQNMYDLSDAGIRDKQWLDLDPSTRRNVLQRMKSA